MGSPIRIHYKRISGVSDVPRPANPQLFFQVETKFFGRRFFHLRGFFVSAGRVRPVAQPCGHSSRNSGTGRSFRFSGKTLRPPAIVLRRLLVHPVKVRKICAQPDQNEQSSEMLFNRPTICSRWSLEQWTVHHRRGEHTRSGNTLIEFSLNLISIQSVPCGQFRFFFFNLQLKLKASVANRSRYISLAAAEEGVSLRWFA